MNNTGHFNRRGTLPARKCSIHLQLTCCKTYGFLFDFPPLQLYVCVYTCKRAPKLSPHNLLYTLTISARSKLRKEIYWLNEKLIDFSTFRQKSENSDNAKSYPHKAIKSSFSKPWDLGSKVQPNSSTDDMMSISVSVMTLSFVEVYSKNSKNQLWKISWIISSTITYKLQNSTYFAILETAGNR